MADLRTSFRFPRRILKHASTWLNWASRIPSTRVPQTGRRGAPVLRMLSIGLAPIGLAIVFLSPPRYEPRDGPHLASVSAMPEPSSSGLLIAESRFELEAEGWTVSADGVGPTYQASGRNPGGYLSASDEDSGLFWNWHAIAKFLGNLSAVHAGTLSSDLMQSQTDAQAAIRIGEEPSPSGMGEILLPTLQMSPPPNDDIDNAIVIPSLPFFDSQDASGATLEPEEDWAECDHDRQGSVWYSYTPLEDGPLAVDTYGSEYDTVLSVWTGEPGSLEEVVCNDDADGSQSAVALWAQAGITYRISVSDTGEGGLMQLNADVGEPPPNDDIENATEIPGLPFAESVDVTLATTAPDDPATSCGNPDSPSQFNSVWYRLTPLEDGLIAVHTATEEDEEIVLVLWTGSPGSLVEIACSGYMDDFDTVYLSSQVTAETTYWIEVAQDGSPWGDRQIVLLVDPIVRPPNDDIDDATPIDDGSYFNAEIDTTLATSDPNDPPVSCGAPDPSSQSNSVWYRIDATEAFPVDLWGYSTFEAALVVWEGEPGSLTEIGCIVVPKDDSGHWAWHLEPGKTYWLEAAQYGEPGGGLFGFRIYRIYPPYFDSFDSPWVIETIPGGWGTNTMGATIAADDPTLTCGAPDPPTQSNTIWFSYTPALNGGLKISTAYTDYETVVGVWTGPKGSLDEVACARHPGVIDPDLTLPVDGGTTYWIEVAQFGGLGGGNMSLFLDYAVVPGCNDDRCVFTISASSDDAGWVSPYPLSGACTFQTGASLIYFGQCPNGDPITSGFRFTGVTLPPGATVTHAYLEFRVDSIHADELSLEVFGEEAESAETFSESNRPDQRPKTTASVVWDIPASEAWNYGENRQTPELAEIVQEVVDRPGWEEGNALAMIIENIAPASGPKLYRSVYSFETAGDEFSVNLPHLVVEFGLSDPDLSTVEAFPDTVVPDGMTTSTVAVTLVGAGGESLPDTPVYLHVSGSQNSINGEAVPDDAWVFVGQTLADGTVTATLSSTAEEDKTIQARGGPVTLSNTASVTFDSTFLEHLLILLAGETPTPGVAPGKAGTPDKVYMGDPTSFQVLAVDENWNLEIGFSGPVEISTTDPLADVPVSINLQNGIGRVVANWGESGAHTLTVTQTGDPTVSASETVDVLDTLVVSDGEIVKVDDVRYPITESVASGATFVPLADVAGLLPGHEIVIITMQGAGLGVFEAATIESNSADGITLSAPLVNNYEGTSDKVVVQRVPHYPNVHVQTGGTLTASPWDGDTGGLLFVHAGNLTVDPNGQIKVDGLGYGLGEGPGAGSLDYYRTGGGGHGGYGGNGATTGAIGGDAYGSVFEPMTLGSGAGNMANSGRGAGAVHLVVSETLEVDGTLSANGDSSTHTERGGGAGGSLWIEAASLTGNGVIEANGGDGGIQGGGGGGGRIAFDSSSNTFTGAVHAYGGVGHEIGGGGTIYYAADNKLVVNNNGNDGRAAALMEGEYSFAALELAGYGHLNVVGEASILTLNNDVVVGDGTAVLSPEGTINAPSTLIIERYALDIAGQLVGADDITLSTDGRLVLHSDSPFYTGQYGFNSITVADGGTVAFVPYIEGGGIYTDDLGVTLQVNILTVDSGGLLTASGLGYARGEGPGAGSEDNYRTGGGGHGGRGGNGARPGAIGGVAYGSVYEPTSLGSGAGDLADSGAGAGAIHLVVSDTFLLNGSLEANGAPATHTERGGGAGGSLWIEAATLTGSGAIEANGGDGGSQGGGGGGGRIAIYVTAGEFTGTVQALGGTGYQPGGEGSVFLGNVDPDLSTLAVDPAAVPTDGSSVATVTVTLKNSDGDPVPFTSVAIALASGNHAYINDQLVTVDEYVAVGATNSGGIARATLRAEIAGMRTVKARAGLVPITQQGTVEFMPGPVDVSQSFVDASPMVRPADGTTPATIVVTARDGFGNPIEGLSAAIFATGSAVVTQPTELTNSLGHTSGSITDTVAETVAVTAVINGVLVDDEASVTFIGADLVAAKTALAPSNYDGLSNTHALAGGTITYTIEMSNGGSLQADDVEVTDTLPAGLTFTGEENGYPFQADGQVLTWQVGSIPVSESVELTFDAEIAADVLGIVTNTVAATTSTTEGDLADNDADLDTTVELPRPAMAVSPSSPTMTVLKGETSGLAATVRNTGAALMTGVTVAPPPNISWVSVEPSTIGDIAPLGGVGFTIHAAPPADLRSGYYRDFVMVTDDFGNMRKIALIVRATEPRRDVEVTIENDQGDLVQGATLLLVRQEESVVVTEGVVETYHESAQKTTPASGRMSFAGLEIGDYDYTVIAADHQTATGVVTIVGGTGTQEVTLTLNALGRIGLSPSEPVLGVVRGTTNSTAITLTNLGAGPLTGLAIAPPPSIPFVTLGLPDPLPTLQPGESMQFLILAGPAADQAGDIFQGYVTTTADDGLSGLLALTVQLTSDAVRDAEVNVVDSLDQSVTGGGSVTLIQQKLTTVFVEGETKTLNQQFTGQLDPNGRASFPGLEPGAYNFIASANGFTKETGEIVIQPGTGVQVEIVAARIDPFSYSWTVIPIEQGYDITLTMTFDVTTPDPVLALPEVCWALDGGPTSETIKVFNPSGIPLNIDALSASLPGASIQIGSFPSVIGSREWRYIPVTATKTGSPATGSAEASFSWDAAPDKFVTFTFNPSSHTSPPIFPAITYTKDFEIQPVVFDPATTYTLTIGQPSAFDWLSLAASPSGPMTWTSGTRINVRLTAGPREYLAEGVYTDSAPITVTGSDGSLRQGTLDFTITQTADGTLIHTNFTLGEIPTVHRQATASGIIRSDECTEWEWSSGEGPQPTLIAHVSGPSASFPGQGGPVYDIGHQQIRIEISQKVMMEGESFKADLDITNTSASLIENVSVHIRFTGEDGLEDSGFDLIPNAPTGLGTIGVGHKASQTWFIQPSNVNVTSQSGEVFRASAAITYTYQGVTETFYTVPEQITVYPAPDLVISYQIPLPTTPCMVFPLKVTIHNRGRGPARDLRFSTAQPRLLDSFSGQPIAFWITGTTLNGVDMENALNLPLGDLPAGESAVIVWTIESSRPGRFVEFTSDYRQANYLGVPLSPLISEIHTNLVPGACAGVPDWAIVSGASECLGAAYQGTYAVAGDTDNPTAGDPINTRTGGLSYLATDLTFPTLAGPLNFERWYASPTTGAYTEDLGFGWTHSLDSRLYFPDDPQGQEGAVLLKLHSANRYEFDIQSDGTYLPYPGACGALTREDGPPTTYIFVDTAQQVHTFDEAGRLLTLADTTGRLLHYVYDGDGRLSQVHDDGARSVTFSYDEQGRTVEVADHSGRGVSYTYDSATGDLASATDVLGGTWTYEYDDAHRLTRIIDPTGSIVERTEYDDQGRVFRQFDGNDQLVVRLDYNPDGTTTLTDAFGNQQTHQYDERGELTDLSDALGNPMDRTYDGNFRPSSFSDPAENTTELAWSGNGANLVQVTDASGGTTRLSYDGLNNLIEVDDPAGGTSTFTYDGTLLTSLTDALGSTTTYTYTDAADDLAPPGLLETITDPLGNTTSFTYDALGQRASMTDALGQTSTYAHDDLGRLIEVTDPLERVTRRAYDFAGRLTRLVRNYSPLHAQNDEAQWNITTDFVYDAVGNMTETVDTFGRRTLYEYDETNHLIAVTDPAGKRTEFELDEQGNLVGATDPLGRTTRYEYDALNRVIKIIDPLAGESLTAYDEVGNVSSSTDAAGNTTTFEYDELNRPITVVDAMGGRTTTEYDALGNVVARTDAAGRTTTYAYDALNRLIRQTDPEGGVTQVFHDAAGNRARTIDPNGGVTHYEYDPLNRLVRMIDALSGETRYAYDAVGNQLSSTDANDNTTSYIYDLLNRTIEFQDPLNIVSRTEYDALGNVLATLDALGNTSTYAYDLLNRLVEQADPMDGHTTFTYDDVGNQLSFTDANGHMTTTVYDALNRPTQMVGPSGQTNRVAYDEVGNVLSQTDGLNQTTDFTYDELNRQVSVTDPLGNVTRYDYDEAGNRVGMTDARGVVTRFEYDDTNRLTAVIENYRPGFASDSQTNVRTEYSYDANGNRLAIIDANGHATAFDYDLLSRIVEERDALGNATVYGYDPVGNRLSSADAMGFETTYVYDELNRLTGIDYPAELGASGPEDDPDVGFTYDTVGNRRQMVDGVGTTSWVYDALRRPTAVTDPLGGTVGYAYDDVGNRTGLTYPDGKSVAYGYDASDRMIQVTDWASQVTSYNYDQANRLIQTTLPNGVISTYDYDAAGRLLAIEHRTATDLLSSFGYSYDAVGNRTRAVEVMSWPGEPMPVAYDVRPIPMAQAPVGPSRSSVPVDPLTAGLAPFGLLVLIPLMRRRELRHPHLVIVLVAIAGLSLAACTFPIPTPTPIPTGTPTATATFTATSTASPTDTPTATFTPTDTATPTDTPTPTPEPLVVTTTTIDYSYDPLHRLTAVDYTAEDFLQGEFFHYTYDAVGNRLTQDTHLADNVYTYDEANRLTSLDGVAYAWDSNGNLLSDGSRTYTYDHANRLSSIVQGPDVYGFGYNGLGDRLQQTVNGATANYTLDIETGLTQVLSDGSDVFVYGAGRIAQQGGAGREYFLGDALNSARQLVNDAGRVGLGRTYEPFGDLLSIAGEIQTAYGFAGEWTDATGLINLRARYYQPTTGRFVQPDPFGGFPTRPVSLNAYPYAYDNPLMYTDASGRNPLLALALGIIGGIVFGAAAGWAFAEGTYDWALGGKCGCAMQQQAASMSRQEWTWAGALWGGILGGVATALPFLVGEAPALIIIGGVGLVVSVSDFVKTVETILFETGLTLCTGVRIMIDGLGIGLSTVGIVQGVRAWVGSGRLLNGTRAQSPLALREEVPLGGLYGKGEIPDDALVALHPSRSDGSIGTNGLDPRFSQHDRYLYFGRWSDMRRMSFAQNELAYGIERGKWTSGDPLTLWVVNDPSFNPEPYFGPGVPPGGPPQWRYGSVVPKSSLAPYHAGG